jgi:hypothetical protein
MVGCHWCKSQFPESQVSSVEIYADDGRLQNVVFACDPCLNEVFKPSKWEGITPEPSGPADDPAASIEAWDWWQAQEAHGNDIEE